ncbi:hypothetical protein K458DRAFT_391997 [Lentithecium fluviatile CBS 122367]|uniref:RING-type domain-containing protein n=1 Tax=Lentithecium fluviatile CBS 122367 TaxID=1168545 RepID=A0A6G1ITC5_9PLEO|nr:hypothetical protein K458DRAFT_391997 [Lentithecium fluviatile CBS 122367]
MAYHIDGSIIQNFLTRNTRPIDIHSLPEDSECSICHNPYSPPDPAYLHPLHPDTETEYALQIVGRGACTHIFGRRCLERHIRAGQPWSHSCPLCRAEWFPPPRAGRWDAVVRVEDALNVLVRIQSDDENVMLEVESVERNLRGIREILYERRWL